MLMNGRRWVNHPPLLMGTQVQQAQSRLFGNNWLAAGTGQCWFTSGSGSSGEEVIMLLLDGS